MLPWGHIESVCQGKRCCSRCGGDHGLDTCSAGQPHCVNCKRQHEASSHQCPVYKKEQHVFELRTTLKTDYKSARNAIFSEVRDPKALEGIKEPEHLSGASFPPLPERQATSSFLKPKVCQIPQKSRIVKQSPTLNMDNDRERLQTHKRLNTPTHTPPQGLRAILHSALSVLRGMIGSHEAPLVKVLAMILDFVLPLLI